MLGDSILAQPNSRCNESAKNNQIQVDYYQVIPGWHALRMRVLARDKFRCKFPGCGKRRHLEVHHIIRRFNGGRDELSNLETLCRDHHHHIHREMKRFAEQRRQKHPRFWQKISIAIEKIMEGIHERLHASF